jgi:hypothetical protein
VKNVEAKTIVSPIVTRDWEDCYQPEFPGSIGYIIMQIITIIPLHVYLDGFSKIISPSVIE